MAQVEAVSEAGLAARSASMSASTSTPTPTPITTTFSFSFAPPNCFLLLLVAQVEAACEEGSAARSAEAEALRVKVAHHTAEVTSLQAKLVRHETAEAAAISKIEGISALPHAKSLLKTAFPQIVQLQACA